LDVPTGETGGNIINALPETVFNTILRALFCIAILFHYPVLHFGMRNSIEKTFFADQPFSWVRQTIETVLIMGTTLIFAIVVPSLSKVIGLTGSLAAFPVCFILPAYFYIRSCYCMETDFLNAQETRTKSCNYRNGCRIELVPAYGVIIITFISMIISIYESIVEFTR